MKRRQPPRRGRGPKAATLDSRDASIFERSLISIYFWSTCLESPLRDAPSKCLPLFARAAARLGGVAGLLHWILEHQRRAACSVWLAVLSRLKPAREIETERIALRPCGRFRQHRSRRRSAAIGNGYSRHQPWTACCSRNPPQSPASMSQRLPAPLWHLLGREPTFSAEVAIRWSDDG